MLHERWCKLDCAKIKDLLLRITIHVTDTHKTAGIRIRHPYWKVIKSFSCACRYIIWMSNGNLSSRTVPISYCRDSMTVKTKKFRHFLWRVSILGKQNWKNTNSQAPKLCRLTSHPLEHKYFICPLLWNAAFQCVSGLLQLPHWINTTSLTPLCVIFATSCLVLSHHSDLCVTSHVPWYTVLSDFFLSFLQLYSTKVKQFDWSK